MDHLFPCFRWLLLPTIFDLIPSSRARFDMLIGTLVNHLLTIACMVLKENLYFRLIFVLWLERALCVSGEYVAAPAPTPELRLQLRSKASDTFTISEFEESRSSMNERRFRKCHQAVGK